MYINLEGLQLGVQDLLLGFGELKVVRNAKAVYLKAINAFNIPFNETETIGDNLESLNEEVKKINPYSNCVVEPRFIRNYGEYDNAFLTRVIEGCEIPELSNSIEQRVIFNIGDSVNHNGLTWIALVDNLKEEPTEVTETQGKWIRLNRLHDLTMAMFPSVVKYDVTTGVPYVEYGKTLIDRVEELENA